VKRVWWAGGNAGRESIGEIPWILFKESSDIVQQAPLFGGLFSV